MVVTDGFVSVGVVDTVSFFSVVAGCSVVTEGFVSLTVSSGSVISVSLLAEKEDAASALSVVPFGSSFSVVGVVTVSVITIAGVLSVGVSDNSVELLQPVKRMRIAAKIKNMRFIVKPPFAFQFTEISTICKSAIYLFFRQVQQVFEGVRCGEGEQTTAAVPLDRKGYTNPLVVTSTFHITLSSAIQLQRLDNGVLNLFRRRPRRKILADFFSWHPKLLLLVGFFLLHNGRNDLGG